MGLRINHAEVLRLLSPERIERYRTAAGVATDEEVLRQYTTQIHKQGELWAFIGGVEVILRNAMHQELTKKYGNWYENEDFIQIISEGRHKSGSCKDKRREDMSRKNLENAIRKSERDIRNKNKGSSRKGRLDGVHTEVSPGHVVANLSLGFWRALLSSKHDVSLWTPCLHRAFKKKVNRSDVYKKVGAVWAARNRIGHHEYIDNFKEVLDMGSDLVGYISPDGESWVKEIGEVRWKDYLGKDASFKASRHQSGVPR
ncbi:hypothetical protein [Dermatophilus congolensis]|uniref:hypothetical protein n=1 Tax=Dermatophilus congolensis TaxID=1863 RepID=UPI001AAF407C|nr:hypothetical protein [Dermatophilus congolensis]MBO3166599.1 hypothetical protein [Dermatophilus congolensis]MBO3171160.1 hypothetical protein [Dermatophilus congolensis]MBO3182413.1 hypothetical protein [Dermatophilus congolensis]MBO3191470.1 hypothetical protein [Dermatophilus congolensis]MBO3211745.1 hypothetical protein [Dermatophilus congolensis]